ncbi:hypothetical protein OROGR_004991 [Orobanche gracilis]
MTSLSYTPTHFKTRKIRTMNNVSSRMDDQELWHNSSHDSNSCWPRSYSAREYDRFVSYHNPVPSVRRSKAPLSLWTQLWRKMMKREKKITSRSSNPTKSAYDEYTYSQNFDPGSVWAAVDPDDLSRSFSARFAVPSRIFENHRLMV